MAMLNNQRVLRININLFFSRSWDLTIGMFVDVTMDNKNYWILDIYLVGG